MAQPLAEQPGSLAGRALAIEHGQRVSDLLAQAFVPGRHHALVECLFVDQGDRLVGHAGCEGGEAQHLALLRPVATEEGAESCHMIQQLNDRAAVGDRRTVVGDERGHPHQRVELGDLVPVADRRPGAMLISKLIQLQCHRDTPHEGRIILPDQDHSRSPKAPKKPVARILNHNVRLTASGTTVARRRDDSYVA